MRQGGSIFLMEAIMAGKSSGGGRGPVRPNTSSTVKSVAGKVLESGRATPSQAKTLAASVMRHEPSHKGPKK